MSANQNVAPAHPPAEKMLPRVYGYLTNVFHDFKMGLEVQPEGTLNKLLGEDQTISVDSRLDNLNKLQSLIQETFTSDDFDMMVQKIKKFCTPNDYRMCNALQELIAYYKRAYPKQHETLFHLQRAVSNLYKFPSPKDQSPEVALIAADIPDIYKHEGYFQSLLLDAIRSDDLQTLQQWSRFNKINSTFVIPRYHPSFKHEGMNYHINLLDLCAAYAAEKCFRFVQLNEVEPTEHTFALSIMGGHPNLPYEVQHLCEQRADKVWKAFYAAIIFHRHEYLTLFQEFYKMITHECDQNQRFCKFSPVRIAMLSCNFFAFKIFMAFSNRAHVLTLIKTAQKFDIVAFNEYFDDIYRGVLKFTEI